jgi:hypothetical protein
VSSTSDRKITYYSLDSEHSYYVVNTTMAAKTFQRWWGAYALALVYYSEAAEEHVFTTWGKGARLVHPNH